jgi:putative transposase
MVMQYRSTRKAVFSVKYHVIWCPKYRRRVLGGTAEIRLKQIINEVVAEFGGMVIEVETMPDHVHLLVELPPQVPSRGS